MSIYGSVEEEEGKKSRHGLGEFCDKCEKKKDTKKVGKLYLCKSCRAGAGTYIRTLSYKNQFGCWCGNIREVENAPTCKVCGKMLCGLCGDYCKDHLGGE